LTGAHAAGQPVDLAGYDVVLTSLPDDDALGAVALGPEGLAAILSPNAVHISTSTVSPGLSCRVAEEHARHGQDYVAAPVIGNPDFARERKSAWERSWRCCEKAGSTAASPMRC
jgi:3-hydroxyisobutyrate dehydrogenase-like beta-hydroxyacid dehydrogenase